LPLSEKARIEVYLPDVPRAVYQELLAAPLRFEADFVSLSAYADALRRAAMKSLDEEAILVAAFPIYHAE
jgi:hypothetical protein